MNLNSLNTALPKYCLHVIKKALGTCLQNIQKLFHKVHEKTSRDKSSCKKLLCNTSYFTKEQAFILYWK